jgi:hypothetical protein
VEQLPRYGCTRLAKTGGFGKTHLTHHENLLAYLEKFFGWPIRGRGSPYRKLLKPMQDLSEMRMDMKCGQMPLMPPTAQGKIFLLQNLLWDGKLKKISLPQLDALTWP